MSDYYMSSLRKTFDSKGTMMPFQTMNPIAQDILGKMLGGDEMTPKIPGATKHDGGKLDLTFCPPEAIAAIARVMEFGALKYARGGWKHVPDGQNRYLAAAVRHIMLHLSGQLIDGETQLAHLDQALCNLAFHAALRYTDQAEAFQGYLQFTGQTLEQVKARIEALKVKP